MKTLTTKEKNMNMAKLGIVSRVGNYFYSLGKWLKQRAGGLMLYTLCVFQDKARRNGSRHSFAFDIPAISGRALFSAGKLASKYGFYVIPVQSLSHETCSKTRTNKGFQRGTFSLQPLNYSTFKTAKNRAIPSQQRPKGTFDENSPLFRLGAILPVFPVCFRRLS